jgi:hypothetical protein
MLITKEMLGKKKSELLLEQERFLAEANCVSGAIQNIDYWLDVLDRTEPNVSTKSVDAPLNSLSPSPSSLPLPRPSLVKRSGEVEEEREEEKREEEEIPSFSLEQVQNSIVNGVSLRSKKE